MNAEVRIAMLGLTSMLAAAPVLAGGSASSDAYGSPVRTEIVTSNARFIDREIRVGPNTRWVNVEHNDTVKFVAGGETFEWKFDTREASTQFPLSRIAPPEVPVARNVMVYVSPEPSDG